jgi:acetyl esterase/lipase
MQIFFKTIIVILVCFLSSFVFANDDAVIILKNIPYVTDGGERQQLDLYLPKNYESAKKALPLVLAIHGGGWTNGSKNVKKIVEWSHFFTENGYAVATINYRLRPAFFMPAQIIDSKSAVRWIKANAKKYNIDTNRIGAIGSSAGGHLVSLLGTSGQLKEFDQGENLNQTSEIQAVVDLCGPTDFLLFRNEKERAAGLFGDKAKDEQFIKKMSPFHNVSEKSAPVLIIHAVDDKTVPIEQSRTFYKSLQKSGVETELIELQSGGHGSKEFTSPEIKKRILTFFDKYLK